MSGYAITSWRNMTSRRPSSAAPIRVMRIVSRMNIGGPSRHVVLLNAGLDPARYDTLLVTGTEGSTEGSLRDLAESGGIRVETVPELGREISLLSDTRTLVTLYRLMRRTRPHIVHTHMAKAGFVGRVAAKLAGVPVIVHTFHGHVFHGYFSPRKTQVFLVLERACARISNRIVTISPRLQQEIAAYGVTPPERISVIPLGFDLAPYAAVQRGTGAFRQALGLPERATLIGAVGRLVPIKNISLLLRALAIARRHAPDLHVVLVGDGELRRSLAAEAAALGITDAVSFAGWQRDLSSVYADLAAVVISSDNEGTPASLIEAMASGCPVIATSVGGVPDLISDGDTGRLVRPGSPEDLAAALVDLVREPEATARMAANARQFALTTFQGQRLINDVDRLYQQLLAERGIGVTGAIVGERGTLHA